jgi:hypothetical protein
VPTYVLKVAPDVDLYVEWSTVVDNVLSIATRDEMLAHLNAERQDDYGEMATAARLRRADETGTSARPRRPGAIPCGAWDDDELIVRDAESGAVRYLRRADLPAYAVALANDADELAALLAGRPRGDRGGLSRG